MSGPAGSSTWFGKDPVYEIGQSLRFEDASSSYLSRTPAGAGNRRTWTFSAWVKQGTISTNRSLFGANVGSNAIYIDSSDVFTLEYYNGAGGTNFYKATTAKLRDASAWYHVVGVWNTTSGTADDRIQLWVNGTRVTEFSASNNPGQNLDSHINNNITHTVGNRGYNPIAGANWDGYMAEVNFIDGLALPAYYFGTTGVHGEWKPIKYVGAYGTNGFYLTGADGVVMSATGGNSTATDGDFKAASFTANGTFTPSADGYVEYLVIAGGGAGAADGATTAGNGGGGAGGFRTGMLAVTASTGYSITVGAGGVGALSATGVNGGNSVFSSITSTGGGGGGYFTSTPGAAGGSGGGGSAQTAAGGAASPAGQGNAGETATNAAGGGGGGGAGEAGGTDGTGQGGDGLASSITGSSVTRAGGGGGSRASGGARAGGDGGGGAGGNGGAGADGSTNTGSGGGAGVSGGESGSGGSGIVIIRYKYQ